jgi:tRNA-specific 2-thiouridylase
MLGRVREELGIETIATGHYARVTNAGGTCRLMRGADISKDQSYFLFDISPETLSRVIFPLGELKKSDVRRLALDAGLPVAEKPESQEVCFVPDGDIAGFIDSFYPEYSPGPGSYVDTEGRRIGSHRGIHGYTVGQRRGLGIGFGERQYVVEIKQATNEIVLGGSADLYKRVLKVGRLNLSPSLLMGEEKGFGKNFSFDARVKIRYKSEAVPARITTELFPSLACPETCRRNGRGEERVKTALIEFETPVRAPTPGQAAVFYQGDVIVGGGWIL